MTPVNFEVANKEFALEGDWPPHFVVWPEGYQPLCRVVETACRYDVSDFLSSILARTGQSFEGVASSGFHVQYPEAIKEGSSFDYLGEEQLVSDQFFDAFVARFTREVIGLAVRAQVELPADVADLLTKLDRNVS